MEKNLSNQTSATYKTLRLGLAVLAFAFPPLLFGGGLLFWELPLAGSMSAYYHYRPIERVHYEKGTPEHGTTAQGAADENAPGQGVLRNTFVGILFAVGALLFAYQGYTLFEDYSLNLAGIMAWGVALFPTRWPESSRDGSFSLHGAFAISFFICIAYVCIFRARDTLTLVENATTRKRYLKTYQFLGGAMVFLPFLTWALVSLTSLQKSAKFLVEWVAVYVFASYWVIKIREASETNVDEKASRGKLRVRPHGLSDLFRPLSISVVDDTRQQE